MAFCLPQGRQSANQIKHNKTLFLSVFCIIHDQVWIINALSEIFRNNLSKEDLLEEIRRKIEPNPFVSATIQENYEIFKATRAELMKKGINLPENSVTRPLVSRRIMSIFWKDEIKMRTLRLYDENRTILNSERREQQDAIFSLESEPADQQPVVESQAPESSFSGEIKNQVAGDQSQKKTNTTPAARTGLQRCTELTPAMHRSI